jgi:hypothetical protein
MFAGAVYYLRHRLRRILQSIRKPTPESSPAIARSEVIENQP